jgi:hypothetical protein
VNEKRNDNNTKVDWRQALGVILIAAGLVSLVIGYVGISGTTETYDQFTYFLSNGMGGAAAIIIGSAVLIIREHVADRQAMAQLDNRLSSIDQRIPSEPRSEPGVHAKSSDHNGSVSSSASVQTA